MKIQRGAALVEFALIALLFFIILFGIIEFGRAWFTYNTLVEATRRGARVAVVCPPPMTGVNNNIPTIIQNIVLFKSNNPIDTSDTPGFLGLTRNDVNIEYLRYNPLPPATPTSLTSWTYSATTATSPAGATVIVGNIDEIAFVKVSIRNFRHTLIIPLFTNPFFAPSVSTTLPSESLGRTTPDNPLAASDRTCSFPP